MKNADIHTVIGILRQDTPKWKTPAVTVVAGDSRDPFHVLISCILSLRTKDETTAQGFARLRERAATPEAILTIPEDELARLIYPVGFYRQKAKTIHEICRILLDSYGGKVPNDLDELLKFKGVGRKTANLVLTLGFREYGICVDTHVHRITNRWGYVNT
ncbi:MAG: endonuclease III, partial [bacterium]|nr:endonuclease III [bacterium]